MKENRLSRLDRRSVLKTTGAALVAATGTATTASATHCVETAYEDVAVYDAACPVGNKVDEVPKGVDGEHKNTCTNDYLVDFTYVDWGGDPYVDGWVSSDNLEKCDS